MKEAFIKGNLSEYKGQRIGIDSMNIIYKAHFASISSDPVEKTLAQIRVIENYLKVFSEA